MEVKVEKVKIRKKLPNQNNKYKRKVSFTVPSKKEDKFSEKYLEFYDDIKIPRKKHDW